MIKQFKSIEDFCDFYAVGLSGTIATPSETGIGLKDVLIQEREKRRIFG